MAEVCTDNNGFRQWRGCGGSWTKTVQRIPASQSARPAWLLQVLRGIGNMDGSDDAEFSLIQGFHLAVVSQSRLNKL